MTGVTMKLTSMRWSGLPSEVEFARKMLDTTIFRHPRLRALISSFEVGFNPTVSGQLHTCRLPGSDSSE